MGVLADGRRAVECFPRSVERSKESVTRRLDLAATVLLERTSNHPIMSVEQLPPSSISERRCTFGRRDDIGEEHRGEDAVGIDPFRGPCGSEKTSDLLDDEVLIVTTERKVIGSGDLNVSRTRDVVSEIPSMRDGEEAIAPSVDHQSRHAYQLHRASYVEVRDQREDLLRGCSGNGKPLVLRLHRAQRFVLGKGGRRQSELLACSPDPKPVLDPPFIHLFRETDGVVGRNLHARGRTDQDQCRDPLGVGSGEKHRHHSAEVVRHESRALHARRVEDGSQRVHPLFEGGWPIPRKRIRRAGTRHVELQDTAQFPETLQPWTDGRKIPDEVDGPRPVRRIHNVERPIPELLIGDVDLVELGVLGFRRVHAASVPRRGHPTRPRPWAAPRAG